MNDNPNVATKERSPSSAEHTRGGFYFTPRVDIYETPTELVLYADMPGVRPDHIDLRYEKGELLLRGRLPQAQRSGECVRAEYDEGDFYRVFAIDESIDSSKIEAECKNGVLTVHLPKVEAARPRQITIKAN
ncbi:MAG: Hsp20/alpha crystallin family protein [Gemmataceae bacterium]